MKKAVLTNRIFMNATPELYKEIDKALTYIIPPKMPMDPPVRHKMCRKVDKDIISIPFGRQDLIPADYEIVDKRIRKPIEFPPEKKQLFPSQQKIHDDILDSCIINALPGWGKTYTALRIAQKLSQRTLVVVHNTSLRAQWIQDVKDMFGFTPDVIGSGAYGISTPIVIGNVQSLYNVQDKIHREFGTVIMDEMHHAPANTFDRLLDTSYARYKIGLSATLKRKDGRHVYFTDYFSPKIYRPKGERTHTPTIDIHNSKFKFPSTREPWATRVNTLLYDPEYQSYVAYMASIYAAQGHKVLVVADRTEFLENVAGLIGDTALCITGKTPIDDRRKLEAELYKGKSVLCGTMSIYKEGISINCLSCLISGTPINNDPLLEQLIGRIIRKEKGKINPVVADIQLQGKTSKTQASNRFGFYTKQGYKIIYQ